jgi:hypothetical protein
LPPTKRLPCSALPHRRRQQNKYRDLPFRHGEFVHVAGVPIAFAAEVDRVPANIDHFWITLGIGSEEPIRLALSTHSRQNAAAGFDPRVRVGIVASTWRELPAAGMTAWRGLDYQEIEAAGAITYIEHERPALETLLAQKTERCIFIEAWGELYVRNHLGIHQLHSRRASCSVVTNFVGRDGAIRFYYGGDATAEMLLFKYCGQP